MHFNFKSLESDTKFLKICSHKESNILDGLRMGTFSAGVHHWVNYSFKPTDCGDALHVKVQHVMSKFTSFKQDFYSCMKQKEEIPIGDLSKI